MRSGVMVGSPVWVRLVTRSTLSTGLGPRRPMVVVEAGNVSTLWCLDVWPVPGIFGALVGAGVLTVVVCMPVCPWSRCRRWAVACACGGGGGGRCAGRLVGVVGCGCACWCVLGAGCGGSVGGGCAVAVRVAVCVVWWSVPGVCFAWMVWGLVGVGGVGVGVWGWVLVVGVSSALCGRARWWCRW